MIFIIYICTFIRNDELFFMYGLALLLVYSFCDNGISSVSKPRIQGHWLIKILSNHSRENKVEEIENKRKNVEIRELTEV